MATLAIFSGSNHGRLGLYVFTKYEADLLCQNMPYIATKGRGVMVSLPLWRQSSVKSVKANLDSKVEKFYLAWNVISIFPVCANIFNITRVKKINMLRNGIKSYSKFYLEKMFITHQNNDILEDI